MKMLRNTFVISLLLLAGWSTSFARMNPGKPPVAGASAASKVASGCPTTTAQIDLAINNIRARVLVGGDLWWDPVSTQNYYEVPRGSGKQSIYAGALWIGGIDATGQLKVAAQTYRQSAANDFWGGPIAKAQSGALDISQTRCNQFDRFWVVDKDSVENFINTGVATKSIAEWPGNGDVTQGELPSLAPYFDANNDGVYNYEDGDYPYYQFGEYPKDPGTGKTVCDDYLFGDRTIWWVFNDVGSVKTESNSDPIGLEVRAQAFAFKTNDQINNMTFYQYQVINRSNDSLTQTYFGVWCDPDLGNASDDYVGCDVGLGLGYVYNGDPFDDGGSGYGAQPPVAGIDFFQGPLADPNDGVDNNKDGVVDEIGETISMSKFVYYVNTNGIPTGNPATTDDYYDYLSGYWLDGAQITYGGDGRGGGTGATSTPCNYMFPDNTDPDFPGQPWTMVTAGIQPDDMRFLESAGTFSLAPGAVNYIKDGVVWAQASSGGPLASIRLAKSADIKAQKLFNSCFELKDGPGAPDVAIRELDQKIILSLENVEKIEAFKYKDPNIPAQVVDANGQTINLTEDERSYIFEGYKIYQVVDNTIKSDQLTDDSKAKLVAQVDVKNNLSVLVNYVKNEELGFYEPTIKTIDANSGITHAFELTSDLFTQKPLANYRPVYYMVVAYAANNFQTFNQQVTNFELNTQAEPYLEGRKNVYVYSAIPHKEAVENVGTILQSSYGDGVAIRRIEGAGNAGRVLDFAQSTIDELMNPPYRALHPLYQAGRGPVDVNIYDPMKVKAGGFTLALTGTTTSDNWYLMANPDTKIDVSNITYSGNVVTVTTSSAHNLAKGKYVRLYNIAGITSVPAINGFFKVDSLAGGSSFYTSVTSISGTFTAGTGQMATALMKSRFDMSAPNDQLWEANKIRMNVGLNAAEPGVPGASNNGFLEATQVFSDASKAWLTGIADNDIAASPANWIASGSGAEDDGTTNIAGQDDGEVYETLLGGTWAPYKMMQRQGIGAPKLGTPTIEPLTKWSSLSSVDVVFTSDRSKWTRSVVIELGEDTMPNVGGVKKFDRRKQASVDKDGRAYGSAGANNAEAGMIDTVGMGWFPGYAYNVETGERLNILFGENSSLVGQNSTDMVWNPTSTKGNDANGRLSQGGMHYVYIMGHNGNAATDVPMYDSCRFVNTYLKAQAGGTNRRNVYKDCLWSTLPILKSGYSVLATDVTVRLRVVKNLRSFLSTGDVAVNNSQPMYEFEVTGEQTALTAQQATAKSALDLIRVVPNPYYAYSSYERTVRDQLDTRVRITNLPASCTISIYTVNGTLVRQYRRDVSTSASDGFQLTSGLDFNTANTQDWDLKNTAGITVASGIYIFHIDAGSLGTKTVKWFGIMRPIDLDSF